MFTEEFASSKMSAGLCHVRERLAYATSTACRPLYQPQVGHTVCGTFAALQRGQTLRAVEPSFQLLARRLRVFDFDFFFFGTAMALSLRVVSAVFRGGCYSVDRVASFGVFCRQRGRLAQSALVRAGLGQFGA